MTTEEYAFFLAYGMTQEEEELESLLDVEMYTTITFDMHKSLEASHGDVLLQDA